MVLDLVNHIRNNTFSEISAKKGSNTLNEIKDAEIIKYKSCTPKHKELLNLFNNLSDTIITDKTLMSSKDKNENEMKNDNEDDDDDETMSQNKKNKTIKGKNDILDEIIDKSKSFEEQIKSLKKGKI